MGAIYVSRCKAQAQRGCRLETCPTCIGSTSILPETLAMPDKKQPGLNANSLRWSFARVGRQG
jgi:hypothetical protein